MVVIKSTLNVGTCKYLLFLNLVGEKAVHINNLTHFLLNRQDHATYII